MSRYRIAVFIAVLLISSRPLCAQDSPTNAETPGTMPSFSESSSANWSTLPDEELPEGSHRLSLEELEQYPYDATSKSFEEQADPPLKLWPSPQWFGLRHSTTHGRNVGRGKPLAGTSWRNRPYYVGGELGTLWLTRSIDENVSRDIDAFGGIFAGYDFDHYWGGELRFDWATPELKNSDVPNSYRGESLFMWSYSFLYYPWGDSTIRPYWRCGIGNTHFNFPLEDGSQHDEWMLTCPLGVGVKYPIRRWLAARAELCDQLTIGDGHFPTQNNITLSFGLEWHFGAHPPSYWPWNPNRHIW